MEIQNIVANLTIKRIPDPMIIQVIQNTTGHDVTRMTLWNVRQRLKKESHQWYSQLREGEYEYLHEYKERINEIMDLQKKLHYIIDNSQNQDTQIHAISELHKLNITLSNYISVAPSIGNVTISTIPETKATINVNDNDIIV
jgi:hypothetical protein